MARPTHPTTSGAATMSKAHAEGSAPRARARIVAMAIPTWSHPIAEPRPPMANRCQPASEVQRALACHVRPA